MTDVPTPASYGSGPERDSERIDAWWETARVALRRFRTLVGEGRGEESALDQVVAEAWAAGAERVAAERLVRQTVALYQEYCGRHRLDPDAAQGETLLEVLEALRVGPEEGVGRWP